MPLRAGAERLDPRRQRPDRAVLVGVRPAPRRGVRPADRGHRREPRHRGGVPRRDGLAAVARHRLGRGTRRRRPPRAVPPVAAPGSDRETTERLLAQGDAYPCYCTEEELEERRKAALARGEPPGYDGRCRGLTRRGTRGVRARGPHRTWSGSRCPSGSGSRRPRQGRGAVAGRAAQGLRAGAIRRLAGVPARGRGRRLLMGDHARDPRRRPARERAAQRRGDRGARRHAPRYAHVPQVNGADGKPLSKRHGSTSVEAFREEGILPEALMNYLALLGGRRTQRRPSSRGRAVEAFDIARVSKNPARFDVEKLEWMNNHYIQPLEDDDLASRCLHFLTRAPACRRTSTLLRRAMPLVRERMMQLTQSVDAAAVPVHRRHRARRERAALIAKAPAGYLASGRGRARALEPWERRGDQATARRARDGGGAQPDEGVPAGPRRGDRVDGLAAAARVARAARSRARRSRGCAPSRETAPVARASSWASSLALLGARRRRSPRPRGGPPAPAEIRPGSCGGGSRSARGASARWPRTRGATTASASGELTRSDR